ncbi:hypothetical protein [Paenarthrobacter aromaticivorans]|uniref:hypothetical protein n=1 Tax=Paenarthrobacter aromaticivorans TaxID=2849150 RepID=UPI003A801103
MEPRHDPASAACMRTAGIRWPAFPQVAVFVTAFHDSVDTSMGDGRGAPLGCH